MTATYCDKINMDLTKVILVVSVILCMLVAHESVSGYPAVPKWTTLLYRLTIVAGIITILLIITS